MIAAPVQCDIDVIPKGSHCVLLKRANQTEISHGRLWRDLFSLHLHNSSFNLAVQRPAVGFIDWLDDPMSPHKTPCPVMPRKIANKIIAANAYSATVAMRLNPKAAIP
jgi:hypothetical protein